jgi:hypothetical protein
MEKQQPANFAGQAQNRTQKRREIDLMAFAQAID